MGSRWMQGQRREPAPRTTGEEGICLELKSMTRGQKIKLSEFDRIDQLRAASFGPSVRRGFLEAATRGNNGCAEHRSLRPIRPPLNCVSVQRWLFMGNA